jgi:Na+/panthothenate symporter
MVNTLILAAITALFVTATIYLGWYGYKSTKNNSEFLLGKNKSSPILIALSYGATFISTSAIVGFGGMSAMYGMSLIWLVVLCIAVGTILAFIVFGKRTRKKGNELKSFTFSDLLGKMFKSESIRTVSALIVLIGMPVYCAAVLLGGVNFISVTVGIDKDIALLGLSLIVVLYVTYGGVIAVMYNDALQGAIMFVGMIFILGFTLYHLGGITEANTALGELWRTKVSDPGFAGLVSGGMRGWTSSPEFGSNIWLTVVTTLLMGVGIGSIAQPQLAVRFMSAKDDKTINRSMWIGAVFIVVILGAAFTIGPLSNVFFDNEHGLTAMEYMAVHFNGNSDMIIPTFVNELFMGITFGDVFISIFILALVCASISTMSALLHTMGASAGYDLWSQWQARKGDKKEIAKEMVKSLKTSRISTMLMMVVVVVFAYVMPGSIIAVATTVFMGLTAAAILPTYAHGLFSDNPDTTAAKVSIAVGATSWTIWALFVNAKISGLVGTPLIVEAGSWMTFVDPLVIGLPLSAIALIVVYFVRRFAGRTADAETE